MLGVHRVPGTDVEPTITLTSWRIYATDKGRHVVGWHVEGREGRVSSAIASFDAETMRLTTRSGRVYKLTGEPGYNSDAEHVWSVFRRINAIATADDVTQEYMQ